MIVQKYHKQMMMMFLCFQKKVNWTLDVMMITRQSGGEIGEA